MTATSALPYHLPLAICLSAAGGYLDAFTWVGHGQVFANAQSGNIVLFGIDIANQHWSSAARRLSPVIAFVFGVLTACSVKRYGSHWNDRKIAALSLWFEVIVLTSVACLPSSVPDLPIILVVAFVAAFQSAIFTKLEAWAFNSVLSTANLHRAVEATFNVFLAKNAKVSLSQAFNFGVVCFSFSVGAGLGAIATDAFKNAGAFGAAVLLATAFIISIRRGGR